MARYSAGTVILQVSPSMKGLQDKIGREAKSAGGAFEREMSAAGERAIEKEIERRQNAEERLSRERALWQQKADDAAAAHRRSMEKLEQQHQNALTRIREGEEIKSQAERARRAEKAAADDVAREKRKNEKIAADEEAERKKAQDKRRAANEKAAADDAAREQKQRDDRRAANEKAAADEEKRAATQRNKDRKQREKDAAKLERDRKRDADRAVKDAERIIEREAKARDRAEAAELRRRFRAIERGEIAAEKAAEREARATERALRREAELRQKANDKMIADRAGLRKALQEAEAEAGANYDALTPRQKKRADKDAVRGLASGAIEIPVRLENEEQVTAKVDALVAALGAKDIEVDFELTGEQSARAKYEALVAFIETNEIDVGVDLHLEGEGPVRAEYNALVTRMEAAAATIKIDADNGPALREFAVTQARMAVLSAQDVDIEVKAHAAQAIATLAATAVASRAVEAQSRRTNASTEEAGSGAGSAANSFRAMNGALFAAVAIGPALIPILGGIAAALLGVAAGAAAVGVGLGVGMLGLAGVGGALTAMGNRDKDLRKKAATPAKAEKAAGAPQDDAARARRIRDALQSLSEARRTADRNDARAARQVADAQRSLTDTRVDASDRAARAEQTLVDAQRNALRVQSDLNDARKEASQDLQDLAFQLRGASLDEQQSVYDMQRAGIRYNSVLEDDQATSREKDEARIAYEQAVLRNEEQKVSNQRLREQAAAAEAAGVEGSAKVVAAKEAIVEANADVVAAEQGIVTTAEDNARRIADAEQKLVDARDERAETAYQGQLRIAQAQQSLGDAYERNSVAAQQAAVGTDSFDSSLFELNESMNALSPAGQRFAEFLYGLKPLLDQLKFTAQETFLPGLQTAMQGLVDRYGPELNEFIGVMGTALGQAAIDVGEWLQSPAMASFFETMAANLPTWLDIFTRISTDSLGGLLSIFEALAPAATTIGEAIAEAAEGFAVWAASEEGQDAIAAFGDYLVQIGPEVWQLFASAVAALANAFIAMAPYGEQVMLLLTGFFNFIAGMDPQTLQVIIQTIFALVAAFQLVFTIMALIATVAMAGLSGAALAAIAIIAVVVAMVLVFWDEISAFFVALGASISAWYDKNLAPTIDLIAAIFTWLYVNVVDPLLRAIGAVFTWVWDEIIFPIFQNWKSWMEILGAAFDVVRNLFVIAWSLIGDAAMALWNTYLSPLWENHLKPFFDMLGGWIEEHVKPKWDTAVAGLAAAWEGLKALIASPIKWVIEEVINKGIIDRFNSFAENFPGTTKVSHVSVPNWVTDVTPSGPANPRDSNGNGGRFATGGILPGYTPGRDVHTFRSATGGTLNLSGGEAILRPEVTRALGASWVDRVNRLARSGGVRAVQGHLGDFATGGILPAIGGREQSFSLGGIWDSVTSAVGGAAGMLKDVVDSVMQFVKDPAAALQTAIDGLLGNFVGGDTPFGKLVLGVPKKVIETATKFVKSIFTDESIEQAEMMAAGGALAGLDGGVGGATTMVLPNDGGRAWANPSAGPITSRYGPRSMFGNSFHMGTDIAGGGPTYASSSGIVEDVGWNIVSGRSGYGILLRHTPLLSTYYGHNPTNGVFVNKGQPVVAGQRIGTQGATGNVTGIHLHYEVATGGRPSSAINAEPFMKARGIQLGRNAPLYDDGGMLMPGLNLVRNATGKPEPVLTAQELEMFKAAAALRGGAGGEGTSFEGANFYSYDPTDILERAREERRRDLAMAGLSEIEVRI